ncbi:MAG: hypothetical protein CMJ18_05590 [Phycisphaeraceae bacterium]|nr:hypothetical protein [Phycisphaeraceae bacterium]
MISYLRTQSDSVIVAVFATVVIATGVTDVAADVWPGWRGDGSGSSPATSAPLHWGADHGVAWRTRIAGEGNSSPIIWDDRIFLTASVEDGLTRLVICLDAESGDVLWQTKVPGARTKTYPRSGRASPTPVTDGTLVYAFFDAPGLIAVDFDGNVRWTQALGPFSNPYNMAGSPVLVGDAVVISCDHQGPSFVAAFDRSSGKEIWRTARDGGLHYATPMTFTHAGRMQIVVNAQTINAYDAATGDRLWWFEGMKHATTPTALFHDGLVYATSGRNGPSVAIDPSGSGDVADTHVRMRINSGGPYVPSPLIVDDTFVIPGDNGRVLLAHTDGRIILRHRVRARIRKFTASPVHVAGHIYWTDEEGTTHVMRPEALDSDAPRMQQVAANPLEETCFSSPAVAGGRLYVRTAKHLHCIVGGDARPVAANTVELPDAFDELAALYAGLPKGEFDDTNLRLAIVARAATFEHEEAIDLLADAALNDRHWDVCEEAIRLLGEQGPRALPALLRMFEKPMPFLKTVAAEHLARLRPVEAVPTLIRAAEKEQMHVRVASIEALGQIGGAHEAAAEVIAESLIALTADDAGVVRRGAIEALDLVADRLEDPADAIASIEARLEDPNRLVADSARATLARLKAATRRR